MQYSFFKSPIRTFKYWFDSSIKNRMILYFSLLFLIVMSVVGFYSYKESSDILVKEIIHETNNTLEQTSLNMDSYFSDMKYTALFISTNPLVLNMLSSQDVEWKDRIVSIREVHDLISATLRVKPFLFDIIIAAKNGYVDNASSEQIDSQYSFFERPWVQKELISQTTGVKFIGQNTQDYYVDNKGNQKAEAISAIFFPNDRAYNFSNQFGLIICDMKLSTLKNLFISKRQERGEEKYLIDSHGAIIFQSNRDESRKIINSDMSQIVFQKASGNSIIKQNGKQTLVIFSTLPTNGWKVVTSIPLDSIYAKSAKIRNFIFNSILIAIVLVIITSILISSRITRSINHLANSMKRVGIDNLKIHISKSGYGEVAVLERKYVEMINRIDTLIQDVYEGELRRNQAEFNLLQSQINPHFLYNTLQLIKAEAVLGQNKNVSKMITSLGYLLRYAMYKSKMVLFKEEIDYIEHYFAIFSHRYGDRRKFSMKIDERVYMYRLPKLLLQPIVENSILHGLDESAEDGMVSVEVTIQEDQEIIVVIWDNGRGIPVEKLKTIQESLLQFSGREYEKIGLNNINSRIKLTYGVKYGIQIDSEFGSFTEVTLRIPAILYQAEETSNV